MELSGKFCFDVCYAGEQTLEKKANCGNDNSKSNMAAIVNKAYLRTLFQGHTESHSIGDGGVKVGGGGGRVGVISFRTPSVEP